MKDFEKHLNKKLYNHESLVDTDSLWENISPHLERPKKKNRGVILPMLLVLVLGFLIGLGTAQWISLEKANPSANKPTPNTEKLEHNGLSQINQMPPREGDASPVLAFSNLLGKTNINVDDNTSDDTNFNTKINGNISLDDNFNASTNIRALLPLAILKSLPSSLQLNNSTPVIPAAVQQGSPVLVNSIEAELIMLDLAEKDIPPRDAPLEPKPVTWQKDISLGTGLLFAEKSLIAKDRSGASLLLQRNKREEVIRGFSVNSRVSIAHRSGIYAALGFNYNRIKEQATISTFSTISDTLMELASTEALLPSPNQSMANTETINFTYEQTSHFDNYFHLVDIPVSLGYRVKVERFSFGIEGGVNLNALIADTGFILNESAKPLALDGASPYHHKVGLGYQMGVDVGYQLFSNLSVFTRGIYKQYQHSFTSDAYPLEQTYQTYGISTGLRLNF